MSNILEFTGRRPGKEYRIDQPMLDELATISRSLYECVDRDPYLGQLDEISAGIEYLGELLSAIERSPVK